MRQRRRSGSTSTTRAMPEALRMMVVPSAWALAAALGGRINDADYWSHIASEAGEQGHHSMLSTEDVLLAQAIVGENKATVTLPWT